MTIDLSKCVTKNSLNLSYNTAIFRDTNQFNDLIKLINNNSNITELILQKCDIKIDKLKLLVEALNKSKITHLDVSKNNIGAEGAAEIGKLSNLTNLNIGGNNIGNKGAAEIGKLSNLTNLRIWNNNIDSNGAAAIANLSNLTTLHIGNNSIGNKGVLEIGNKLLCLTELGIDNNNIYDVVPTITKLPNLTYLNISSNACMTDKAIGIIAGFSKLTKLYIAGYNLDFTKIEKLSNLISCNIIFRNDTEDELVKLMQDANNPDINLTYERVKNMVFKLAPNYDSDIFIRMVINSPEKYPFAINSRDNEGHSLLHFYNQLPDMQQFLFQHGIVPDQEQDNRLNTLARDTQSVHTTEAVKLVNFITDNLFKAYGNIENKQQLLAKAKEYQAGLNQLYQDDHDSIRLRLLSFTDESKRNTLGETLAANQPVPNDQDYVATLLNKVKIALTSYLPGAGGQYRGYPTTEIDYGDGNKITIPQSLGLVKSLIDTMEIPVAEKLELLVTLMRQNPQLVATKLEIIQDELNIDVPPTILVDSTKCHKFLASNPVIKKTPQTIDHLFNSISGLDINQTLREQKALIVAEAIYLAATTYNAVRSACVHGVLTQIIKSATEISSTLLEKFTEFREEEIKKEKARDSITETNIQEFIGVLAKKLINFVEDKPVLQETLAEFALGCVEISKPSEITIEQQKILAKINEVFTETIQGLLPLYIKAMPGFEEYKTIITELAENKDMRKFTTDHYTLQDPAGQSEDDTSANSFGTLHPPTDEQSVETIGGTETYEF